MNGRPILRQFERLADEVMAVPAPRLAVAVAIVLLTLFAPDRAAACTCIEPGPPCQAVWQANTVFIGRVVDVVPIERPSGPPDLNALLSLVSQRVRIQVVEAFRGAVRSEIDVFTGSGGGDCGYGFEAGETYLIYAGNESSGRLYTSICSRTRPLREAGEDLAYLRDNARQPSALGIIQGRGKRVDESSDGHVSAEVPFEGAVVTASSTERRFTTNTGRDGSYGMRVPAGRYQMDFQVPEGLYVPSPENGRFVDVLDTRGCATADFITLADGRVSGRVVDARGDPVTGITVDAVSFDNWMKLPDQKASVFTNEQGIYELTRLPPGRYIIGVGHQARNTPPGWRILHPGVTDDSAATRIELGSSERLAMTDLVLPAATRTVQIAGTVRDRAGRPVSGVKVYLYHAAGDDFAARPAVTDREGRFSLSTVAGQYRITADIRERTSVRVRSVAVPPFDASATLPPFDITLPD